jgi:hypothetical protein
MVACDRLVAPVRRHFLGDREARAGGLLLAAHASGSNIFWYDVGASFIPVGATLLSHGGEVAMSIVWQVDDEIQLLARIFLAIFVLVGLMPFFRKSFARWHDYLISLRRPSSPGLAASISELDAAPAEPAGMSDIEYIVFTRLSQGGVKGASLAVLAEDLHMESLLIQKALQSLQKRGLVRVAPGLVIGRRYSLSREGLQWAIAEGYMPKISQGTFLRT